MGDSSPVVSLDTCSDAQSPHDTIHALLQKRNIETPHVLHGCIAEPEFFCHICHVRSSMLLLHDAAAAHRTYKSIIATCATLFLAVQNVVVSSDKVSCTLDMALSSSWGTQ